MPKGQSRNTATLQFIFFPSDDLFYTNPIPKWLSREDRQRGSKSMATPYSIGANTVDTRHPSLLVSFDDTAYTQVYEELVGDHQNEPVKDWNSISTFIRVVESVAPKVLSHIIYWWAMDFKRPENANRNLRSFDYIPVIERKIMTLRDLNRTTRGQGLPTPIAAFQFTSAVVALIWKQRETWKEKSLQAWVRKISMRWISKLMPSSSNHHGRSTEQMMTRSLQSTIENALCTQRGLNWHSSLLTGPVDPGRVTWNHIPAKPVLYVNLASRSSYTGQN